MPTFSVRFVLSCDSHTMLAHSALLPEDRECLFAVKMVVPQILIYHVSIILC